MNQPRRFLTQHRFRRLIAYALSMLGWVASVLFADRIASRRHIRHRYKLLRLRGLTRLVCNLAIVRAVELSGIRPRVRQLRNAAPSGFRRRMRPHSLVRAIVGARLRKQLKRGSLAQRIQFLVSALSDIDAFARRHLVRRARRRLTKLCAVVAVAPSPDPLYGMPPPSPAGADSS